MREFLWFALLRHIVRQGNPIKNCAEEEGMSVGAVVLVLVLTFIGTILYVVYTK